MSTTINPEARHGKPTQLKPTTWRFSLYADADTLGSYVAHGKTEAAAISALEVAIVNGAAFRKVVAGDRP